MSGAFLGPAGLTRRARAPALSRGKACLTPLLGGDVSGGHVTTAFKYDDSVSYPKPKAPIP